MSLWVRLFADVLNDVAIFLEIIAPVFQQCFRLIVCTAAVSKVCQTTNLANISPILTGAEGNIEKYPRAT